MRRLTLTLVLTLAAVLVILTGSAQAVVVTDQGSQYGVALVPGTRSTLSAASVQPTTTSGSCSDPWLSADLVLPDNGLCFHSGGSVMHSNETYALTWDPDRRYWQGTRNYAEQFLRDVAAGSGTFSSPYAVTSQYSDLGGRAQNSSLYGGGCIDYGSIGGFTCKFGSVTDTGAGHDLPPNGCAPSGSDPLDLAPNGAITTSPNDVCLTDAALRAEMSKMISATDLITRTQPGHRPTLVLLMPPRTEVCLDDAGNLCSANSNPTTTPARFCSYHGEVDVPYNGQIYQFPYVVQPWTPLTKCDEPDAVPIPANPDVATLAIDVGLRLVSPLSQADIAAIVNPLLNGWFALDGSEINDNGCRSAGSPLNTCSQPGHVGCVPLPNSLDKVTVGTSSQNPYLLQREFNNAGVIETDPNALGCTPSITLVPRFVVPSAVNRGDVVNFDGSTSPSALIVPKLRYQWNFGDGPAGLPDCTPVPLPAGCGPSVTHTYAKGGTYTVTLAVTDRGGNVRSLSQAIQVLGANGLPVSGTGQALLAHLQLIPQSLQTALRRGVGFWLRVNQRADGIVTLSIPRSAALRAGIRAGRGPAVAIGRGTISGLKNGATFLHLRVSSGVSAKLQRLHHVALTVHLTLYAASRDHVTIDVAGRY